MMCFFLSSPQSSKPVPIQTAPLHLPPAPQARPPAGRPPPQYMPQTRQYPEVVHWTVLYCSGLDWTGLC